MMKLSDLKDKIDAYFENLNPLDFIKRLEQLGIEFEPIEEEIESNKNNEYKIISNIEH